MKKAKEIRGKQSSWGSKSWQVVALFLTCLTLLSVLAACGESSSPTGQPGAVATATDQATPSNPATTITATTTPESTTIQVATTTVATTTSAPTTITVAATTNSVTTEPATTEVMTTVLPTTIVPATTVAVRPATTTVVVTKPAATATPRPAPVTTTTVPAKASGGQSHTFTEKDNNGSVQLKVGDTLLAQLIRNRLDF